MHAGMHYLINYIQIKPNRNLLTMIKSTNRVLRTSRTKYKSIIRLDQPPRYILGILFSV